jgi:hypothetical protein
MLICFARVASLGIAYDGAGVVLVTGGGFRSEASLGSTLLTSRGYMYYDAFVTHVTYT